MVSNWNFLKIKYTRCCSVPVYLEFKNDQYEDIRFVTDTYFCGRGFKIFYEQVPCEYTTTSYPPVITTPPPPPVGQMCGGVIMSEYFEINFQNTVNQCIYHINKADQVLNVIHWFLLWNSLYIVYIILRSLDKKYTWIT